MNGLEKNAKDSNEIFYKSAFANSHHEYMNS